MKISYFKNIRSVKPEESLELDLFLSHVFEGRWQDEVLRLRAEKDEAKKADLKKQLPNVTISGTFEKRTDKAMKKHSSFIAIDLDDVENIEYTKQLLSKDRYCYAIFTSCSGKGLCLIVQIEPERHRDAFYAICAYLQESYDIVADNSGVNESRARFVSYDPFLQTGNKPVVFKKYLKRQGKRKMPPALFIEKEFDRLIQDMVKKGVDCTNDYRDWVRVGFALADKFGEQGRIYFHQLSAISAKYDVAITDKKYNNLLKHSTGKATISIIYWYAKQNGINIFSNETTKAIRAINSQKKAGRTEVKGIKKSLKIGGIEADDSLIDAVLETEIPQQKEDLLSDIIALVDSFGLKKNLISRNIEWRGNPIDDNDLNSIFLDVKMQYPKSNKELVQSVIFSNRTESYNPIIDFLKADTKRDRTNDYPNIQLLLDSVNSDTQDFQKWMLKWLVALIATANRKHSPLMLVLSGEKQGTGKTHFFRYLLPQQLQSFYAESKMDSGKDDEILMTKKWIICDDEMGGKSKREAKRFKEITSKQWINVREPYGRVHVDLKRTAMFCGTSNDLQLLNDETGNRRYLPIHVLDIDHDKYNECDKKELLWELNHLYESGYDYTVLKEEIERLAKATEMFKASTPEEELILTYLRVGDGRTDEWLPISIIIDYLLVRSQHKYLSNTRVGMLLTKMGYKKDRKRIDGATMNVYCVRKVDDSCVTLDNPYGKMF